jgi:hypothetical protein
MKCGTQKKGYSEIFGIAPLKKKLAASCAVDLFLELLKRLRAL